jgi:dephospho-CoA kinase
MTVLGLTGSFGTGKSFVASVFRSLGAKVLDADAIAHECLRKGRPAYRKVVRAFGTSVLGAGGAIARPKLARLVFGDRRKLARLERIVHPEVIGVLKRHIRKAGRTGVIVIDAPLLVEAKATRLVDRLVVVTCSQERQIERCGRKFRIGRQEVLKRIGRQIPLKKKVRMADFVIDNNGPKSRTTRQVKKLWEENAWK